MRRGTIPESNLSRLQAFVHRQRDFLRFLAVQRLKGFPKPTQPDFDADTTAVFRDRLRRSSGYLEFGSGGSTLIANEFGIRTLTVESDRFYARAVREALPESTPVRILEAEIGLTTTWSRPLLKFRSRRRLAKWRRYSTQPFVVLDEMGWFPDFVLVDGRFRRACALQTAAAALARNCRVTLLFDDYFRNGRDHYHEVEKWLGAPERYGRAALFEIRPGVTIGPEASDVAKAAEDPE